MAYDRTVPGAAYDTDQRNPAIKSTTCHNLYEIYQHLQTFLWKLQKNKIKKTKSKNDILTVTQHYSNSEQFVIIRYRIS